MAELGIFTSCLQIADTAWKLKQMWSEIRDGPKDVQDLVKEVIANAETLGNIRQLYQSSDYIVMTGVGWEKCYQLFEKSAEALDSLMKELQALLTKHKRTGSVRLYLRSSEFTRCREKFQRAQMIMLASQQAYSEMFAVQNFSLILKELRTISAQQQTALPTLIQSITVSQPDTPGSAIALDSSVINHAMRKDVLTGRSTDRAAYRINLPHWLTRKSFQVLLERNNANWGFTLRMYNRVGPDSAVFKAAEAKDWGQVQHLIATGQASPFDIDRHDFHLLGRAATQFNPDACRMLISCGLSPYSDCDSLSTVQRMAWAGSQSGITADTPGARETISLFTRLAPDAFFNKHGHIVGGFLNCQVSLLTSVVEGVCSNYDQIDTKDRISMAFEGNDLNIPRIKVLLGASMTLKQAFDFAATKGSLRTHRDLLYMAAGSFAGAIPLDQFDQSWIEIVKSIVEFESESSSSWKLSYRSTLSRFLGTHFNKFCKSSSYRFDESINQRATKALRHWVGILKVAGANLERYAAAEKFFWSSSECCVVTIRCDKMSKAQYFRVQTILSGPEVEDWKVYVVPTRVKWGVNYWDGRGWVIRVEGHTEYEMAGQFWNWIENPELFNIPGTYLDAEQDDERDSGLATPLMFAVPVSKTISGPIL